MIDWQARQDEALAKIHRSIAIIETALGILQSAPPAAPAHVSPVAEPVREADLQEQARFEAELARDAAMGSAADWPEDEP